MAAKVVSNFPRKQKDDNPTSKKFVSLKKESKLHDKSRAKPQSNKRTAETISIPSVHAETPDIRKEEIVPAETKETLKNVAKPIHKLSNSPVELEKQKKLPLSPKLEKRKPAEALSNPTKLIAHRLKTHESNKKRAAAEEDSSLDAYKHKPRNEPTVKPAPKYGISTILGKDAADRDNKNVPNGKVIPYGYKSLPPSPSKLPVSDKPVQPAPTVTVTATAKTKKLAVPKAKVLKVNKTEDPTQKKPVVPNANTTAPVKTLKTPRSTPARVNVYFCWYR